MADPSLVIVVSITGNWYVELLSTCSVFAVSICLILIRNYHQDIKSSQLSNATRYRHKQGQNYNCFEDFAAFKWDMDVLLIFIKLH